MSKKTDSPKYHTVGSQNKIWSKNCFAKIQNVALFSRIRKLIFFGDTVPLKVCVKVLRNGWGHEWLPAIWYCREIDSSQYDNDTAGRRTRRSMILRGDRLSSVWYCGETDSAQYDTPKNSNNSAKTANILTYWSVAQADSNEDKNWMLIISLDLTFTEEK